MCFVLIPSGPVERDEHASGTKQFTKQLLLQCFNEPLWCLGSCICCPCANYRLREDVLDKNWSKYECCQGKLNSCMCINSEWCQNSAQQCPQACAAMESCCCACAMIGNRDYLIDIQHYESDPCDRRMIWCSNTCCWICRESITEEANCGKYSIRLLHSLEMKSCLYHSSSMLWATQ